MYKNNLYRLGLIFVVVLILMGCSGQQPEAQPQPTEEMAPEETESVSETVPDLGTIKVGYLPITGFVPFFVAQGKGYFEEQGLTVEFQSFRTGDDMIAPLSLGQLDVGGGETGPALFNGIDQGLDVTVVSSLAAQTEGHGGVPLLVRLELLDSGEIDEVADLEGRKVALNVERGMAEYLLAKALEKADLTVDDVEIVTVPFPEVPQALANAAVDAAILPHPLAALTLRPGENDEPPIAGVLIEGDKITDFPQNGVVYFGQRFLDPANQEVAERFLIALIKAARDIQGDEWRSDDEVVNAILEFTTVPEPAVRNGVSYYFDPNGEINRSSTEDIQAYHVGRGYVEFSDVLPLERIITDTFLERVIARIGEYEN